MRTALDGSSQGRAHLSVGLLGAPEIRPQGRWAGLGGDALAFLLAERAALGRWVVVVDGEDRADQILRGLRLFHPHPKRVIWFPSDDNRPYDGFSPDPSRAQGRIKALHTFEREENLLVVTTSRALLQRVPSAESRRAGTREIALGTRIDRDVLVAWLTDAGYLGTSRSDAPGRFAVRGDVLDVWPTGNRSPVRIDLFDDEVERLRRLDPDRLLPVSSGKRVTLLPAREERIDASAIAHALVSLGRAAAAGEGGDNPAARRRQVIEDLKAGVRFSGIEEWLPALVDVDAPLDALTANSAVPTRLVVVYPDDVILAIRDHTSTARRRYELLDPDERPLVTPEERLVPASELIAALSRAHEVHELPSDLAVDLGARPPDELIVRGSDLSPLAARLRALADQDVRVGLVVEDEARGEKLVELFAPHGLTIERAAKVSELRPGVLACLVGDLPRGFIAAASGWAVIAVHALFGAPRRAVAERVHALWSAPVTSTAQLKQNDFIVHRVHGVGLYRGLQRLEVQPGAEQDFVKLEFRDGDLLFLPVTQMSAQLSRYAPAHADATPTLDKLGGTTFEKRKGKIRDNLLSMAQDLVALYARREVVTRPSYPQLGPRLLAFEARFPYRETPDQASAIEAVMEDLSRPHPMDRLVCGDVGFGKTEVAMRAAMRVLESGRQVAVLCPTTVLAHQHLRTFRERFSSDESVNIGMWSRFTTGRELKLLKKGLSDGTVHIVIGTTALLGREVHFLDLGLVVIDEEHRFGVKQKDRLKRMRTAVDVLALSATPIPRTLQLALSGAREMSLIATPPPQRLEVRTTLARPSQSRVRDAILSELERGGQCWYVHNRVETIYAAAEQLHQWVPEAKIAIAHGQMEDDALEAVLVDFIERRSDVLVCTAIVESGIDLPNVNTMLIDRADLLGLAQLYQLRGRVGRGDRRANCILLTPEETTGESRKRLRVIVENQSLGSGFSVASADLALRGGGNLLGAAQSGSIDQVGYDTWVELLQEAVHHVKGELDRERIEPEVEVPVPAFLPEQLITDTDQRLAWYQRLGRAHSTAEIERIIDALESEHGELPEPSRNLGDLMAIRILCREQGIVRCSWLKVRVLLELHPKSPLHERRLAQTIAHHPKRFSIERKDGERAQTISVRFTPNDAARPLRYLRWVFTQLTRSDP